MKLSERLAAMDGATIAVGIAGPHPSWLPAAELAKIQIQGRRDGSIPARDFWTPATAEADAVMRDGLRKGLALAVEGRDPRPPIARAAEASHDLLIAAIEDFTDPPNAASTIRKKGRNDPLVDEGDLRDATFGEYKIG